MTFTDNGIKDLIVRRALKHHLTTPLLMPLVGLITGIVAYEYIVPTFVKTLALGYYAGFVCLVLLGFGMGFRWPVWRYLVGFMLWSSLGCMGMRLAQSAYEPDRRLCFDSIQSYKGYLVQNPARKGLYYDATLRATMAFDGKRFYAMDKKVRLRFYGHEPALSYGDELWIRGRPTPLQTRRNPSLFDFETYSRRQGIGYEDGLSYQNWIPTKRLKGNPLYRKAQRLRKRMLAGLKEHVKDPYHAIASGLLLGYKHELTHEAKQTFAKSGIMHVFAVSGLHVGIIYVLLHYSLALFLPLSYRTRTFMIMLSLWGFALVVGLSPSIVRAVIMFSVLHLFKQLGRYTHVYQRLAVAAFCILLFNPHALFMPSFQLSFLAVLGILMLYPKLTFKAPWAPIQPLVSLSAVSIAAQTFTFPLVAYHFQMFSLVFLAANLMVIPLLFLILPLTGLVATSALFHPQLAHALGALLTMLLAVMDKGILWITQWPFAYFWPVYWDIPQLIASYFFLFLCLMVAAKNYKWAIYVVGVGLLAHVAWGHYDATRQQKGNEYIVWNIPRASVSGYRIGKQLYVDNNGFEASLYENDFAEAYLIQKRLPYGHQKSASKRRKSLFNGLLELDVVGGVRVLIVRGALSHMALFKQLSKPIESDYVVVTRQAGHDAAGLLRYIKANEWVLDSSHSPQVAKRFVRLCEKHHVSCYDVGRQGAWVKQL